MTDQVVLCPVCGLASAAERDNCPDCGEPLSTIGRVMQRHEESASSPRWLRTARNQASLVRSGELREPEQWMEEFQRMEHDRLATVRQDLSAQHKKDRRLMLAAAIAFTLLLAGALFVAVFYSLRG
ncbi:MAG: hypothetical protein WBR18_06720 [Anaerolineales bacterium]